MLWGLHLSLGKVVYSPVEIVAGLREGDRPLHGGPVAGDDDLPAAVVVGDIADLAAGGLRGDLGRDGGLGADQRRHRPHARRDGALHGVAPDPQEPRRVGDR